MKTSQNLLLGMLATTLLSSPAWAADKVGVIGAAGATVTVVGTDKQSRTAKTGDEIFLGDVLQTDGAGKAQLIFLDRSSITLKPNSNLTIDTFVYDPSTASGELALKSAKGAFRFIGGALSKKKEVKLTTPVGTIGIRGGIADTEIAADGKTDAFFLYGEKMSFTNQNGEQTSTTQFGSGLALATGAGVPQPVTPAQAAAHFNNFRTAANDAPLPGAPSAAVIDSQLNLGTDNSPALPAGSGENAAASPISPAPQGNNDQGPGGDSGPGSPNGTPVNDAAPAADGGSGNAQNGLAPRTQQLAATDASSAPTGALGGGLPNNSNPPRFDAGLTATARQTNADGAITNVVASGIPLSGGQLSIGGASSIPAALTPPPPPVGNVTPPPAGVTAPPATNTPPPAVGGTVVAAGPTYTQFGRYIVKDTHYVSGVGYVTDVIENGGILGNPDGTTGFDLSFNDSLGGNTTTHHYNELGSVAGASTLGSHTNSLGHSTNHIAYRSPMDSWRYYNTKDTVTGRQTSMVFGKTLVSPMQNSLYPAIYNTRDFVNSAGGGNSHNVGFFDFMPSFGQYHQSPTNQDPALFEYNFLDPTVTLSAYGLSGPLPQNPLGMAVNWENKSFMTGFLKWNNSLSPYTNINSRSHLVFAAGNVNPDGLNYLDGNAFAYTGVSSGTVLNTSMTASNLSDIGVGTVNARQQIFGSDARGVEGILLNQTAVGTDHRNANLNLVSGSNSITVNVVNHRLSTGDSIRFAGVNSMVYGIPNNQINMSHTVTVLDADNFIITTTAPATGSTTLSTTNMFIADIKNDSQLAVARTLSASANDNLMRSDLAKTAAMPTIPRTLRGFAGGTAVADHEAGGGNDIVIYTNSDINNVTVTQNKGAGTVNANLNLSKVSTSTPLDGINATFDGSGGFVGHRMWGANQNGAMFTSDTGMTNSGIGTRGALVAGTHIVDRSQIAVCEKCDFVEWGVWAGESFNPGNNLKYGVNMVPVVVGEVTNTSSIPATGIANYAGKSYATFYDNSTKMAVNSVGEMAATADLTNRTFNSLELTHTSVFGVPTLRLRAGDATGFSPSPVALGAGQAVFAAGTPGVNTDVVGTSGVVKFNGALFGPQGQNIGGNFELNPANTGGGIIRGAGVFLGCQTPTCP